MIELLRRQGFVEMPGARAASAVYLLLHFGEVVYVGRSTNIFSRLGNHWRDRGKQRAPIAYIRKADELGVRLEFDQILVKFAKVSELDKLEGDLIRFYKPRYNVYTPSHLPNVKIDVVALAQEVGIKLRQPPSSGIFRRRVA